MIKSLRLLNLLEEAEDLNDLSKEALKLILASLSADSKKRVESEVEKNEDPSIYVRLVKDFLDSNKIEYSEDSVGISMR